jgi:hypothetical protein
VFEADEVHREQYRAEHRYVYTHSPVQVLWPKLLPLDFFKSQYVPFEIKIMKRGVPHTVIYRKMLVRWWIVLVLWPTHQVVLLVLVRVIAVASHHRADDSAHRPHQRHRAQAHPPAAQRLQIMGPVLGSTQ